AAFGDVFLTAESQAAVAAVTGFHQDSYFVDEHGIGRPETPATGRGGGPTGKLRDLLGSLDADELAHAAAVFEFHHAGDFREQRVVFAPADIQARLDLGATLPHDDRAARHQLPAEHFYAEPL